MFSKNNIFRLSLLLICCDFLEAYNTGKNYSIIFDGVLNNTHNTDEKTYPQCPTNITVCEADFYRNILLKIDDPDISFNHLVNRIRLYNYRMYKIYFLRGKNKKQRRLASKKLYRNNNLKNLYQQSYSDELGYLENICGINYEHIDKNVLKIIAFKNNKIKKSEKEHKSYSVIMTIFYKIVILFLFFILINFII